MTRLSAALAAMAFLLPAALQAQERKCGPMAAVAGALSKKYGEAPVAMGLDKNGFLLELWGNRDSRSWTITVTSSKNRMCLIAMGGDLEILPRPDNSLDI